MPDSRHNRTRRWSNWHSTRTFRCFPASNGTINVLLGGQVPLVTGDQVDKLSLSTASTAGAADPTVPPAAAIVDQNGNDVTQTLSGGQLGALLSVQNQILPQLIGGPSHSRQSECPG